MAEEIPTASISVVRPCSCGVCYLKALETRMIRKLVLVSVVGWSLASAADEPQTLHVYHIGNSLTRSITMDRLHLLFAEHDIDYQFSTQLAAGCTLSRHWAAREKGMQTRQWETNQPAGDTFEAGGPDWDPNPKRFGPYWEALTRHKWDAVVLQPYRSHMKDDLPALRSFIRFALDNQSATQFLLYQTWPNRPVANPEEKDRSKRVYADIDYQSLWDRKYPYDENTEKPTGDEFQSRDYFDKLLAKLCADFNVPIRMIPVGEVWYECDRRIKALCTLGLELFLPWCQAVTFFPVVEACGFLTTVEPGGPITEVLQSVRLQFLMQQLPDDPSQFLK